VIAEFRYGKDIKSDAKPWQMWQANEHRWVNHGYLIEECKRHAQGSISVAETSNRSAAPARFERATPALGERCSIP
jgi:hypothetical protein